MPVQTGEGLGTRLLRLAPLGVLVLIALASVLPGSAAAADADATITQVMDADDPGLPGVTATVNGSGGTYYGDSLRVTFDNTTDRTYRVAIPIGTRFAPQNESVQTMFTAGNETIVVPPGTSSAVFKAFCGEKTDAPPGAADQFRPDGRVSGRALDALKDASEQDQHDSGTQQKIWDAIDEDAKAADDDKKDARTAAVTGAITTGVAGGAAVAAARRAGGGGSTRPLAGDAAIKRLVVTGHDTVEIDGRTYVLPPDRLRPGVDGIAFETKNVDGYEVIDRDHVSIVPSEPATPGVTAASDASPLPPPTSSAGGGDASAPATSTTPTTSTAETPVVKLTEEEKRRIIDWGVKNNRTPDDIQEDLDAQNRTAGGTGSVPVEAPPVRVTLGEGRGSSWYQGEEVTLSAEEAARHKRLRDEMKALEPEIFDLRRELTLARIEVRKWMSAQLSPEARWVAGTWELIKRANRLDNPGAYLAKLNGAKDVEDLLVTKYGKPRYRDYHMTSGGYDAWKKAVEAWRIGPQGLEYSEQVGKIRSDAIRDIQSMTSPDPKGATSWFNLPKSKLDAVEYRQWCLIDRLKQIQGRQKALTELERGFAERIRTGPVR